MDKSNGQNKFQFRPLYQGALILSLVLIIMLFMAILNALNWVKKDPMDIWLFSSAMLMFFILLNTVINFMYTEVLQYYRESIFTYTGLLIIVVFIGAWVSGISIFEAESYAWILLVFSLVYIVFLSISGLMRKIVQIALRQEKEAREEQENKNVK